MQITDLSNQPAYGVPKPNFPRNKKTQRQRGAISPKVAREVDERAGGRCERCGWQPGNYDPTGHKMRLERAHITRRWKLSETTADDLLLLCGPSTNSKTCHAWADHTSEGREYLRLLQPSTSAATLS
jgi:hypothetical protein